MICINVVNHFLLSLPNEVVRHIAFALFLIIVILRLLLHFLSTQILSGRVLSDHGADCSEIWGYDRYGYEALQEGFKIQNGRLEGCPRGMPKFCLDKFSVTTGWIVLNFGDLMDMNMKFCNRVSKGPPGVCCFPHHFIKGPNI